MSEDETRKTLTDADIVTDRPQDRRGFMGLMAAGGVAGVAGVAALAPGAAQAQAVTDSDNGNWSDRARCGRGSGGVHTGLTDRDNGTGGTDAAGRGRGAPYC